MIKVELFKGGIIICKGISSDPLHDHYFLLQMLDGQVQEVYWSNIKHIGDC